MTYRELLAHEREFAAVEITRARIDVALAPEQASAAVVARMTLHNGGSRECGELRLLLAEKAALRSVRDEQGELEHETEIVRLRGLVARTVEIELRTPLAPASACDVELEYELSVSGASIEAKLGPDDGFLLIESLWTPTLHTPLSAAGFDRAALGLRVTLPDELVPVALPALECTARSAGRATYEGASDFRFAPFLAYGRYARFESPEAEVYLLENPGEEAAHFLLDAARELRGKFDAWLGPPALERPKIVAVRRLGSSWGAPYCLLLDDSLVPRQTWQQPSTFETLAHELAHTWFGGTVAPRGKLGYLHESFAQYLCACAVGARYGAAAEEREYEVWQIRDAREPGPLGRGLAALSMLDEPAYVRGSYLVGPHFLRALEQRLGREPWHALLRAFAQEFDGRGADLDDLRTIVRAHAGTAADDLFDTWLDSKKGSDDLYARGRELIAAREEYWRTRDPRPDEALWTELRAKLDEALSLLSTVDFARLSPEARAPRAGALLREIHYEHEAQTTVLDRDGNAVFHVQGLTGGLLGHKDVRGASVYGTLLEAREPRGERTNFDYRSADLKSARENALAFARHDELGWTIVVEGHAWRAME